MHDAVIIDAIRTPVGKGRRTGVLSNWHPVDLMSETLMALAVRNGLDPAEVDDVVGGVVTQIGEQGGNLMRQAVLAAGWPDSVPATTIDRKCGSSQQAAHFGAQGVMAAAYDVVIAGGVEMLSRVVMQSNTAGADHLGTRLRARYGDAGLVPQGIAAELVAAKWNLTREDVDDYAVRSHQRALDATLNGSFTSEMLSVEGVEGQVTQDEGLRPGTSRETLAGLATVFRTPEWEARYPNMTWTTTAGNASQISDGASAVLITSAAEAKRRGWRPRARFTSFAVVGDDPILMLTGIIPATRKALDRAGLTIEDIDVFEVNEAFASVVLAWQRELGVDMDRVNVNGGAIAIGHPLGGSGTRLMATMLNALESRDGRYGLQVMCEAGGQANATIIERINA